MKANGRRRWRKWAKSRRIKMNAHHRALYTGARMRKAQPVELAPLPTPAFRTWSLVGMTMGARKRAARRWLWPWMQRREALQDFREMIAEAPGVKTEYHLSRLRYRIGQRLRPCPGCTACLVCITCENGTCKRRHLKNQHCDGSGVLPANR